MATVPKASAETTQDYDPTSRGVKVLLMGAPGTGKTYSCRDLNEYAQANGMECFYFATDPGYSALRNLPNFHIHYVAPAAPSWDNLRNAARQVNTMSMKSLQELAGNKEDFGAPFFNMLAGLNNFIDQRTKVEYGDVTLWGTDRILIFDGITNLAKISVALTIGSKPIKTQPEWGVIQQNIVMLLEMLTTGTSCHLVMMAHLKYLYDEILGKSTVMVETPGKAISPTLPNNFDDCILTVRDGAQFFWDTADPDAQTKARHIPVRGKQDPSYAPLFEQWKENGGVIQPGPDVPEPIHN